MYENMMDEDSLIESLHGANYSDPIASKRARGTTDGL